MLVDRLEKLHNDIQAIRQNIHVIINMPPDQDLNNKTLIDLQHCLWLIDLIKDEYLDGVPHGK